MIPRDCIHCLSNSVRSPEAVRGAIGFDELQRRHPLHELFVLWYRADPSNQVAVVFKVARQRSFAEPTGPGWNAWRENILAGDRVLAINLADHDYTARAEDQEADGI